MPHYEFFCKSCNKSFSKVLTIAEHGTDRTTCPHCGSQDVEQRWSAFTVITSKKSAECTESRSHMQFNEHMLRRRQKVEKDLADPAHFRTVYGTGYKFVR
jgi:putative FmdB family regulatory protein